MNTYKLLLVLLVTSISCKENTAHKEQTTTYETTINQSHINKELFYHYSIWYAFVNKVFEGDLTVKELKTKGDIGLGSYTKLDGELVMLDGIPYQINEEGKVRVPTDDSKIVYANSTFFEKDYGFKINETVNYEKLRAMINDQLPSKNMFYAFKIHGNFKYMNCGGLHKQEPPFEDGLDILIPNRPLFERENFSGTMVGFFCPEFIGDINVAAYHLHFISDDKTFGGHVMDFETDGLEVELDEMKSYQFDLPDTEAYRNVGFEAQFQYKKK